MRKPLVCCLSFLLVLAFCLAALAAEPAKPTAVQTELKRVALFKNGLGFFVRQGALPEQGNAVLLGPFAAPAHGTFWVSCPSTAGLKSVVSREVTLKEQVPVRTFAELLRANVGREIVLGSPWDGGPQLFGTILSFTPERPRRPEPPDPYAMGPGPRPDEQYYDGGQPLMFFKTPTAIITMDPSNFGRAQFTSPDFSTTLERDVKKVELEASFSRPKAGDWLSVSYLAKGITWVPAYLIDISDPKVARLSASAVIVNEAEDLQGAHVDLITGYPNLQFADLPSPVGRKQDLAGFLSGLSGLPGRAERADVMMQRAGGAGMGGAGEAFAPSVAPSYGAAALGRVAEDLFLYPLDGVTLRKGETGYYPLFTESVPYAELYQWRIPDYISPDERYLVAREGQAERPEIVWHSLRLTNTTKLPWTTAPAEMMKDSQIIGQDTLDYTAPKGEATIKITQAMSVKAEQTEREVEREREAVRLYGDSFDRVTIEGKLRVTNYQEEAISLEIKKTVSGEMKSAAPQASDTTLARGLARMNPVHELTWKVELKPGQSQEITYTYQALIRR